ncbi:putative HTH-type transcriptional regulator YpoP [Halobacillus andaensis]|uniref:HTH-type transcriptional regulator YpoP n=1 Tax=Halobacillus andaensis TaxID=1176239 RepID=A0A917BCS7_HALAA|nr:MarR family transcriptional regulator [Halobacillus andaensis]MBP2006350.1 DNA-binding MarR family transcriptional regulator [Halobacillus andaensis]GGF34461.1 putative HTH-type transcriptional regulator YpoP [Halobacillus andaensis]
MNDQEKIALITELEGTMRHFIKEFRRQLNEQLGEGFTSSEFAFLRAIHENSEQNVSCLASTLNVSNSHATSIMDRLEEKELITRTRSKQDRRVVVFQLTTRGEHIFEELHEKRTVYMQERFKKLSKKDLQELIRIFHIL